MASIARLLIFTWTTLPASSLLAQDETQPPTEPTLRRWVAELDHDDFEVRQTATRQLFDAGAAAVPWIRKAAEGRSLEAVVRSIRILSRMAVEGDPAARRAAEDALADLAHSDDRKVARRAAAAIKGQQVRLIAEINRLGGRVDLAGDTATAISFSGSPVTDEDLAVLKHFPDVVSLGLSGTNIGDAGLRHVKALTKLESIDLYRSQVGNDALKHLKTLKHLKHLPMGETNITDEGLVHLHEMPQLDYLGLRGNNVTDEGLKQLKPLKNLTGLYLGETKVTDAGLVHISHLDQMQYLRLHTVDVTDAGLEHLRGMKRLARIDIHKTGITAEGVRRLKEWFPECQVVQSD